MADAAPGVDLQAEREASQERSGDAWRKVRARRLIASVGYGRTWQEYREAAANEWPNKSSIRLDGIASAAEFMEPEERHLDPVTTPVRPLEPPDEEDLIMTNLRQKRFTPDQRREIGRLVRHLVRADPKVTGKRAREEVLQELGIEISEGYLLNKWLRPLKKELKREPREEKKKPAPASLPVPTPASAPLQDAGSAVQIVLDWPGRGRLCLRDGQLEADGQMAQALASMVLEGILDELKPPRAEADDED